jgi:plastocyanin
MRYFDNRLRLSIKLLIPRRSAITATILGLAIGGTLAFHVAAEEDANTVIVKDFLFTTKELTVPVGTTVKWVNNDDIPHNVVDKGKSFRSKPIDTNETFSFTFTKAGTFNYFCSLHPQMGGTVIVQ